jgi:hypothetical protein
MFHSTPSTVCESIYIYKQVHCVLSLFLLHLFYICFTSLPVSIFYHIQDPISLFYHSQGPISLFRHSPDPISPHYKIQISSPADCCSFAMSDAPSPPPPASTGFPMEIIRNIIREMDDPSTLAAMMQVSSGMYKLAAPRLYSEVDMYGANLDNLVCPSSAQTNGTGSPDQSPRESKAKLLSKIKHMAIHDIPPTFICKELLSRARDDTLPQNFAPKTISIRPSATWKLMQHNMSFERDTPPHPFILYLEALRPRHLCIQLPLLIQTLEDSLVPQRSCNPRNWNDISSARHDLRDAFQQSRDRDGSIKDLFGFSRIRCPNITIHNLTMLSTNRAFVGLSRSASVRIFYRPCSGSDGEVTDKIWDHYCYNHRDEHNLGIIDGKFKMSDGLLRSGHNAELIDMDWVRDKYDSNRDDHLSRSLNRQVRRHLEASWGTEEEKKGWGKKRFKMSREVDACVCCQKRQLSVDEVCPFRA